LSACAFTASAQLDVTVLPVKLAGQKAVLQLAMTNNLADPVESARAVCFLVDGQGRMVGQSTKWVIGGTKDRPPLPSKSGTTYNFVISGPEPFVATNLTAKVSFARVTLGGGRLADVAKEVRIEPQ